jgi:hypothetical protein
MKTLIALLAILFAIPAYATCTQITSNGSKDIVVTCTTGTEADPTTDATLGLRLDGLGGFSVMVESTAGAMTSGGVFKAFFWNLTTLKWVRVWDGSLDLITAPTTQQSWDGGAITSPQSRVMWVPYGVGVGTKLYIKGTAK